MMQTNIKAKKNSLTLRLTNDCLTKLIVMSKQLDRSIDLNYFIKIYLALFFLSLSFKNASSHCRKYEDIVLYSSVAMLLCMVNCFATPMEGRNTRPMESKNTRVMESRNATPMENENATAF